jgi:ABC-2 type transport system permease protein
MLPAPLWARLGADVPQLRALLDARLKLDDRRPLNGMTRPNSQKKQKRFAILLSMFISLFSGIIYTFVLAMNDASSGLFFYFGIFQLMLSFLLISDFSNVIVDTRDKYIVLPAPVSGRTLFLTRLLHVGVYMFRIVLPMSIPGAVVLGTQYGVIAALWLFFPVLLLAATALFLVLGAYLLMLRFAGVRRFKAILTSFQIAFSIIVFGSYYLLPRLVDSDRFMDFSIGSLRWARYTPPYWLMSLYTWILPRGPESWVPGILAIAFPLLCMYLVVRVFAPRFTALIGEIDNVEGAEPVALKAGKPKKKSLGVRLSRVKLLNRSMDSQAGFLLVWLQTARSRSFKMKVYPSMATTPVMILAPLLAKGGSAAEIFGKLQDTSMYLFLLYMCTLTLIGILGALSVSESYKAAWIYRASPLLEPGAIIAAGYKVVLIKYILPFYFVISALVLYIWGARVIPDILLAVMNVILYGWCIMRLNLRKLPFTEVAQDTGGASRFLFSLLGILVGGLLGLAHYLTFDFLILKVLFIVLSGIAIWLVSDSVLHTSWAALKSRE